MSDTKKILSDGQRRCFVVMGFGTKTDYEPAANSI